MTASLLVGQLQRQERQQGTDGRNHLRAGIPGLGDEAVEAEPGQQWREEEEAGDAGMERAAGREVQFPRVGDSGRLGMGRALAGAGPGGSSASVGEKKGVVDTTATIGPKTAGHGFQGRGFVAEPHGDLVEWLTFDEDRPEGLVLALEGLLGLEEEPAGVDSRPMTRAPRS